MTAIDIHFEGHKEYFTLEKLLDKQIPLNLSFTPYDFIDYEGQGPRHSSIIINLIKDGINAGLITIGQQGYKHKCKYKHEIADPWHENFCFYNKPLSLEEQIELMTKGKELIVNTLGTEPMVYSPPNHMYDKTTLEAAKFLGYKYFADSAILNLNPYESNGIIIVPESKFYNPDSPILYIHYDEIGNLEWKSRNIFWHLLSYLKPLTEIKPLPISKIDQFGINLNTKIKHASKHLRDVSKAFKN